MGQIITFYSYKGGTGRTMSVANMACLLAKEPNKKVLVIDWDLEAPGLDTYFSKYFSQPEGKSGLVEFILKAQDELPDMLSGEEDHDILNNFFSKLPDYLTRIEVHSQGNGFQFLKAGKRDSNYAQRSAKIKWHTFFARIPGFFTCFAEYLSNQFNYILIDSRTGFTDVGGICTMLMPEKLVLVFTPNIQSLNGVIDLAEKATKYRRESDDLRPLIVYPLPSRVELAEEKLKNIWIHKYKNAFEELFKEIYDLPRSINLNNYFEQVMIRHSSLYAYGEQIAVLESLEKDITDNYSLENAYESFCIQLTDVNTLWEYNPFSSLERPYNSFFLFSENNSGDLKQLLKHLAPLNGTVLSWNPDTLTSVERWGNNLTRKFANSSYDFIFLLISKQLGSYLLKEDSEGNNQLILETLSMENGKFLGINIDDFDDYLLISKEIKLLPSKNKNLDQWDSKNDGWNHVAEGIKEIIIQKIDQNV